MLPPIPVPDEKLTPTEARVLAWIARGKTAQDIADILNVSIHTVYFHERAIRAKAGVECMAAAVAQFMAAGALR